MAVVKYFPVPRENSLKLGIEELTAMGFSGAFLSGGSPINPLFDSIEEANAQAVGGHYDGRWVKVTFEEVPADD